jgi:hypothetical protein
LKLLAKAEDVLIRGGVLPSDFTVMVMRKKRFALRPLWSQMKTRFAGGGDRSTTVAANADFRSQAHSREVRRGFHHWERTGRWMGERGELELLMNSNRMSFILAAPIEELRRRHPAWEAVEVRVRLEDSTSGLSADLDPLFMEEDRPVHYVRRVPESFFSSASGHVVRLILTCEQVWVPAETLAGSDDMRTLTVQVMQAGFEDDS